MVLELHLHVEARELAEMAVRVRVLRSEDGADLENALQVGAESHLLVELRALREACVLLEILELEDVGAALRRAAISFGVWISMKSRESMNSR